MLNKDRHPAIRVIGVSHTACKDGVSTRNLLFDSISQLVYILIFHNKPFSEVRGPPYNQTRPVSIFVFQYDSHFVHLRCGICSFITWILHFFPQHHEELCESAGFDD